MKYRIGRRELLASGMGLCASLAASSALGQSSETAPRESGTDALGRGHGRASRLKAGTSYCPWHFAEQALGSVSRR